MDEAYLEQPRPYRVHPRRLFVALGGATLVVVLVLLSLLVLTPLRELIPGYGTTALRHDARLTAVRLAALQDSLEIQREYLTQLRQLLGGVTPDTADDGALIAANPVFSVSGELAEVAAEPTSTNWADHEQPALPVTSMPADVRAPVRLAVTEERYLSSIQLPALPPVNGFLTNGFNARTGHYAIDIAVREGTMVRAVGDGYVIFSDWTHEGGYALIVQHADGYVSIYKHNQRVLKRVGDRVHAREAIAVSGNSGESTSGPHLHFEFWNHGLAQDPRLYLVGL